MQLADGAIVAIQGDDLDVSDEGSIEWLTFVTLPH